MSRRDATAAFQQLQAQVSAAIAADDPTGLIASGAPADEYDPEVGTILPRLQTAHDASDVQRIVFEEFNAWFGPGLHEFDQFAELARALWAIWTASGLPR